MRSRCNWRKIVSKDASSQAKSFRSCWVLIPLGNTYAIVCRSALLPKVGTCVSEKDNAYLKLMWVSLFGRGTPWTGAPAMWNDEPYPIRRDGVLAAAHRFPESPVGRQNSAVGRGGGGISYETLHMPARTEGTKRLVLLRDFPHRSRYCALSFSSEAVIGKIFESF